MIHQLSFQTLVERYERVNRRVRELLEAQEKSEEDARNFQARMAAMQIRMDLFDEKIDRELARVAAVPTNGVVDTQYNIQL